MNRITLIRLLKKANKDGLHNIDYDLNQETLENIIPTAYKKIFFVEDDVYARTYSEKLEYNRRKKLEREAQKEMNQKWKKI
jgi:hypothetical protein